MTKPIAVSGVQPTGTPTLGNLFGAFLPFTQFQQSHQTFYFIVDLHALTIRPDPKALQQDTLGVAAWYMASGLDPNQCTLFAQSHVKAHAELGWIMNCYTQMGELERMTQFKDKSQRNADNINAGLFTYPSLMAGDILLYDAESVPVGDDQKQHVELCRNIAVRMNNLYGDDLFVVPEPVMPTGVARVKDLQEPTRKMSKSLPGGGCVLLTDELKTVEKKIKRAVTDTLENIQYSKQNQPGISNLLELYAAAKGISLDDAVAEFEGGSQYGPLKVAVAEAIVAKLEPIQQECQRLMADKGEIERVLKTGAERANEVANVTLQRVKDAVGLVSF